MARYTHDYIQFYNVHFPLTQQNTLYTRLVSVCTAWTYIHPILRQARSPSCELFHNIDHL